MAKIKFTYSIFNPQVSSFYKYFDELRAFKPGSALTVVKLNQVKNQLSEAGKLFQGTSNDIVKAHGGKIEARGKIDWSDSTAEQRTKADIEYMNLLDEEFEIEIKPFKIPGIENILDELMYEHIKDFVIIDENEEDKSCDV